MTNIYSGFFQHKDFSIHMQFEIEREAANSKVYFSSLEQNAIRIPTSDVTVTEDSLNFRLQSDQYAYTFKNKWEETDSQLEGMLEVDSKTFKYTLYRKLQEEVHDVKKEEIQFKSNGISQYGTIWSPEKPLNRGLVLLTSSGNSDRSASRAEAIQLAQKGYKVFHYDKRGTGKSEGNWTKATIQDLASDDINAIKSFALKTGFHLGDIGILGSSQGGAKVPLILNALPKLRFGIVISCPASTLLESDLNYWRNRNSLIIGDDILKAEALQKQVFEHIGGILSRKKLEFAIALSKQERWFPQIWIPNLDKIQIDKKLAYSPMPHFRKAQHPLLILEGSLDHVIPKNSSSLIFDALTTKGKRISKKIILDGASHSMQVLEPEKFQYWSKIHSDYYSTIENWISSLY